MEEQWHTWIKEAYTKLVNMIESHKSTTPYDRRVVEFLSSVALLKKAVGVDLKEAMRNVILGSSTLNDKKYRNIDLMKGLDSGKCGFVIHDSVTDKSSSGTFMRSDWLFQFQCKTTGPNNVPVTFTSQINTRDIIDSMKLMYKGDAKMTSELLDAWFHCASFLAMSFNIYIKQYCLDIVSADDRKLINDLIPEKCTKLKPASSNLNLNNVFRLLTNASNNEFVKAGMASAGISPAIFQHSMKALKENVGTFNLDDVRTTAAEAFETGNFDLLGPHMSNIIMKFSSSMPTVDVGSVDDQD